MSVYDPERTGIEPPKEDKAAAAMKRLTIPRILEGIAQARQTHQARVEAFLAGGGVCVRCFDRGVLPELDEDRLARACPGCARGTDIDADRRRRKANLLIQQADTGRFNLPPTTHPNKALVDDLAGWALLRPSPETNAREFPFLLLTGAVGVGKSQLAAWLLRATIIRDTQPGRFVSVSRMIDDLRPSDVQDSTRFTAARDLPLVVLDDLGVTPLGAGFVEERLYIVIDERYTRHAWTVLTTNKEPDEEQATPQTSLMRAIGERIYWRIIERAVIINCGGPEDNLRKSV